MNIKISVVIPVWNRELFLARAVASVLEQTRKVDEILLVDDGSTDKTWSSIEKMQHDTVYLNKIAIRHCGKPGAVRNVGIEHARNEWIAFLDSDDTWLPHKIDMQIEALQKEKTKWIHTREIWMRNGKTISQKSQRHRRAGNIFEDALKKCIIGPSTVLMHRSLFDSYGMFQEDLEIAEDYELWLRMTAGENISYIDEPCVVKHSGTHEQLSTKYDHIENFRIKALQSIVRTEHFTLQQKRLAKEELQRKEQIWMQGAQKRKTENV